VVASAITETNKVDFPLFCAIYLLLTKVKSFNKVLKRLPHLYFNFESSSLQTHRAVASISVQELHQIGGSAAV